jgi:transcriptional regulator with PAS, ATPase and Fis domain
MEESMSADYYRNFKDLDNIKNTDPVWKWMTASSCAVLIGEAIREAVVLINQSEMEGLPVVDDTGAVVGIVTKSGLMSCLVQGYCPDYPVSEVMMRSVITLGRDDLISKANKVPLDCIPVVDEEGKLTGILTRRNILNSYASQLEHLQQSLDAAETLSIVLESAYEGIAVIDKSGIIREINEAYCRFIGRKREEVIGKHVTSVIENTRLHIVIETGVAEKGYIQRIQGQDMVVHRIPIFKGGTVVGAIGMLIFEGVTELYNILGRMQELSRKVNVNDTKAQMKHKTCNGFDNIIGRSENIYDVKRTARKAANTPSTVLITGESGTGKEMFARAIHEVSPYAEGNFISVNCAAIPEHLLEAELFGYEDGAFTGAKKGGKPGKFELAHKGTLFLDEIGDMPTLMQSKILRVLQEREVERVGSVSKHHVDVRVIAATNRKLERMLQEGKFREDLYYRLNIIRFEIPPLRERKEDIPDLLMYHLYRICEGFGIKNKTFSPEAMAVLINYKWPGNVRELVNTVEMLASLSESDVIQVQELPLKFHESSMEHGVQEYSLQTYRTAKNMFADTKDTLAEREKELILKTLVETYGNKAAAARKLGIQRSTLYEKLKKYGLNNEVYD